MIEKPASGRTPWDALVEVLSTWKLLFLIFIGLVSLFIIVHFSAEPGTNVEFFGLKYQKAKPVGAVPAPAPDDVASYLFPKDALLELGARTAIPILDGTLAVRRSGYAMELVGDSIGKIKVGARNIDGTSYGEMVYRKNGLAFNGDTRLEIEFRGRVFALSARRVQPPGTIAVTVEPVSRATLHIRPVTEGFC